MITLTSVLAVVSLLFRNWLFIFWKDFTNSKELYEKLLQLDLGKHEEEEDEDQHKVLEEVVDEKQRRRALSIFRRRQKLKMNKETHFKKWI